MCAVLGVDLGTSSLKVVAVDPSGEVLATRAVEYAIHTPRPGYAEQDPQDWIQALQEAVTAVRGAEIEAIALTGQMHTLVAVDHATRPLGPAVLWSDRRCEAEVAELEAWRAIPNWVTMTGNRPNVSFTLAKVLWLRRHSPLLYESVHRFLLPKDYLRWWMTGEQATDETDASATLMFDIRTRSWSEEVLHGFDLNPALLPPVLPSSGLAGRLHGRAAVVLGLRPGIPVYAGAGDAECQALGNGVVRPGRWLCTIGTSGQIFTPVRQPVTDPNGRIHTLCHAVPGLWHVMGATLSAGLCLQWLVHHVLRLQGDDTYERALAGVAASPPGARALLFLPYLTGERTPHMDPHAKGAFVGLQLHHTKEDLVRAVMEGVLFSLRDAANVIQQAGIPAPTDILMTGGAAGNPLWRQMAADVFGVPVSESVSRYGAAFGAAILAAAGMGWFRSVEEAVDAWVKSGEPVEPHPDVGAAYDELFALFRHVYPSLRATFDGLSAFASRHD